MRILQKPVEYVTEYVYVQWMCVRVLAVCLHMDRWHVDQLSVLTP